MPISHSRQSARSVMSKRYSNSWSQTLRVSSVGHSLKIMRSNDS